MSAPPTAEAMLAMYVGYIASQPTEIAIRRIAEWRGYGMGGWPTYIASIGMIDLNRTRDDVFRLVLHRPRIVKS